MATPARLQIHVVLFAAACACVLGCGLGRADALPRSDSPRTPVLLTFDVEADEDVPALRELQLAVPATYFILGQFAESHPDTVRELAADPRNTIGSHSYAHHDLTTLQPEELRKDLLLSRLLLRDLVGYAPAWFRAPLLATNRRVADMLAALGFTHDSSDRERWMLTGSLVELPVSAGPGILASDYDLFVTHGMSDEAALSWLVERFEERAVLGRPFVVLMHPRIIAGHRGVLAGFVDHAARRGADFMGAQNYAERTKQWSAAPSAVWINFSNGRHEPAQVSSDLQTAGITDAFVMAKDPEGNRYFAESSGEIGGEKDMFGRTVAALKPAGIRVHAWLPVLSGRLTAERRPELAMVSRSGSRSETWLSPSHPQVGEDVAAMVRMLIAAYEIDGVHLDYVRYPDLEHDYGLHALDGFASWSGVREVTAEALLADHYNRWTDWRTLEITRLVAQIGEAMRQRASRATILSAALIGDAAVNHRSREAFGQDYASLAGQLDWVLPMAYSRQDRQPVDWIGRVVAAARYHVGDTLILTGIEAYQEPGRWSLDAAGLERAITVARKGSDGVAYYPYLHLFGRAGTGRDMPPGAAAVLGLTADRPPAGPAK